MKRKAFTLVEMLIVLVVLGILAAGIMYASDEAITTAKATKIISDLQLLSKAAESWYLDNINFGWKYGSRKNKTKKTNPNLVSWDDLNNKVKKLNIRTLKHLPTLCNNVGLKIIKLE